MASERTTVSSEAPYFSAANATGSVLFISIAFHVSLQEGGYAEPKLIYVQDGRKKDGENRWQLLNVWYISGVYANSDMLWVEVLDYIDKAYDMDTIEKIYLSGDGAPWIKNGLGWIKGNIFALDRYHLSRYVTQATAHMGYTTPIMCDYINSGDKELFNAIIPIPAKGKEHRPRQNGSVRDCNKFCV